MQKKTQYFIPINYKETGYIFNGMISKRNAIDGAALGIIAFIICQILPIPKDNALSIYIVLIGISVAIGITGINQIPISEYILIFLQWRKRKKFYLFNAHGGVFTISAAELIIDQPQLRDNLANALDTLRAAIRTQTPELIEGNTFEFVTDPHLEALLAAQKKKETEQESASNSKNSSEQKPTKPESQIPNPTMHNSVDFEDMMQNIVLNDIEGGQDDA